MIKELTYQENIIINVYAINQRAPKYIELKMTKYGGEIENSVIIVGDFHTPFLLMYRTIRKSTRKQNT